MDLNLCVKETQTKTHRETTGSDHLDALASLYAADALIDVHGNAPHHLDGVLQRLLQIRLRYYTSSASPPTRTHTHVFTRIHKSKSVVDFLERQESMSTNEYMQQNENKHTK